MVKINFRRRAACPPLSWCVTVNQSLWRRVQCPSPKTIHKEIKKGALGEAEPTNVATAIASHAAAVLAGSCPTTLQDLDPPLLGSRPAAAGSLIASCRHLDLVKEPPLLGSRRGIMLEEGHTIAEFWMVMVRMEEGCAHDEGPPPLCLWQYLRQDVQMDPASACPRLLHACPSAYCTHRQGLPVPLPSWRFPASCSPPWMVPQRVQQATTAGGSHCSMSNTPIYF